MGASKKQRGQQRKAAKKDRVPQGITLFVQQHDGSMIVHPENKKHILPLIQSGIGPTIHELIQYDIDAANFSLVDSGVLLVVLDFLKRCEDETFHQVMSSVGGDLNSPIAWIDLLMIKASSEQDCRLQIAENIGPLVKCMCNDTARLFFKSNKHWKEGIGSFVGLIHNMIHNCWIDQADKKIVYALLQNEGLLRSIIQWQYWGEHRSDILKELAHDDCKNIARMARDAITTLITDPGNFLRDDDNDTEWTEIGKEWLLMCGTTPIVSKDYDPSCMVSYAAELIRQIKTEGWNEDVIDSLDYLVGQGDCVDKDVINGIIDLGLNYSADEFEYAAAVIKSSYDMINIWMANGKSEANDTRVAFAIRAGLIDMCLNFIGQYGRHIQVEDDSFCYIQFIFYKIHDISLHEKSAKAIRSRRCGIEEKIHHLDENTDITNKSKCKKLLDMVKSILDINGSYCCRCNKSLTKTEVMECNGCGCMAYCSRACQRDDWFNGHKLACCKTYNPEISGQFQGRFIPEEVPEDVRAAAKLNGIEKNISMIQMKLFLDNAENILSQAKASNLPIHDCVVDFDLKRCPPYVEVQDYREEFTDAEERRGFVETRSKDNITCIYHSRIINGEYEDGDISHLRMQKLYPHKWLTNKK